MAFFDNFSKKVQDVAFVATEKAQQVAAVAGEKANAVADKAKTEYEMASERRSMDNEIHVLHGHAQAFLIAYVTNEETYLLCVRLEFGHVRHDELFEFVSGVDDDLLYVGILCEYGLGKFFSKGTGSACDEDGLI